MEGSIGLRKGAWTSEEDHLLRKCIEKYGEGKWYQVPFRAGLNRCRKSCRLRWLNYLKPDIKRGKFTADEVDLMMRLHKLLGNRWALIAGRLPGRTSNDVKNYWNTHLRKETVKDKVEETVKIKVIRPRPRPFTKNLYWLERKELLENDQSKLHIPRKPFSTTPPSEDGLNSWWESLFSDKEENKEITCSIDRSANESISCLPWDEQIAAMPEVGKTSTTNGQIEWTDCSFDMDHLWDLVNA
ncbi:hypothetical protein PVL29_018561 [Vitis rotundifolia]|uniref:Uncharacterized protein n=1 Tax=Vitis rotundifolia TaxID=103349 RepID=A0AA38Z5Y2_VITRO|nr:hypothetical protein PVL29_018561 [Vitis rotundifolia]